MVKTALLFGVGTRKTNKIVKSLNLSTLLIFFIVLTLFWLI